jgi:hypothetical protein
VIGDLHADIDALKRILVGLGLINQHDQWVGKDAKLVTVGDHLDRGSNSRAVMDLLLKLESESLKTGGAVVNLIGNHEFITADGHYTFAASEDVLSYREFKLGRFGNGYENAFIGDTVYARWFRARPVMHKIEDTLFVHAGLSEKMLNFSMEQINEMATAWMRFVQGVGEKPDVSTEWVIHNDGPLWSRDLSYHADTYKKDQINNKAMDPAVLDKLLKHFGVNRVAIGHSPMLNFDHTVDHPFYGSRVISTDTGISIADNLLVTGFKIENGLVTGYHFNRRSQSLVRTVESKRSSFSQCLSVY